jgi:hypothetical protein
VSVKWVTAGYHRTLAIPLRGGRYFTDDDREVSEAVVILSEAAARMLFGGEDALGRIVLSEGQRRVVANVRQASLEVSPHPEVYLPMAQGRNQSYGFVLLRTRGDPNDTLPALRTAVAQVLPGVPLRNVARLDDLRAAQTAERRLSMLMFGLFGLLGLAISAVGIFGVIARCCPLNGPRASIQPKPCNQSRRIRMKAGSSLVAFTMALYGFAYNGSFSSAAVVDITGKWEVIIHYQPDDSDYRATYVLKQDGQKVSGTYHGMYGPAGVTGTVKSDNVTLSVTVKGSTARFSGKITSATTMTGTVTGTSDKPGKWSAGKKK